VRMVLLKRSNTNIPFQNVSCSSCLWTKSLARFLVSALHRHLSNLQQHHLLQHKHHIL
jgi:hypothetical protein